MNNEDINITSVTNSWLNTLKTAPKAYLSKHFYGNDIIGKLVKILLKLGDEMPVNSTMIGILKSLISQLREIKDDKSLGRGLFKGMSSMISDKKIVESILKQTKQLLKESNLKLNINHVFEGLDSVFKGNSSPSI